MKKPKRKIKKKKHGWTAICLMTAMFLQLTACSHAPAPTEAETGCLSDASCGRDGL